MTAPDVGRRLFDGHRFDTDDLAAETGLPDGPGLPKGLGLPGSPGLAAGEGLADGAGLPPGRGLPDGGGFPDGRGLADGEASVPSSAWKAPLLYRPRPYAGVAGAQLDGAGDAVPQGLSATFRYGPAGGINSLVAA